MGEETKMNYIPDPIERMEDRIESMCSLIDENDTYPCCICGRRFKIETMDPISARPDSDLMCGREDCHEAKETRNRKL